MYVCAGVLVVQSTRMFCFYGLTDKLIVLIFYDLSTHLVLAQRGYLKEQPFINYLKYLLYWKKPEYAKFLK